MAGGMEKPTGERLVSLFVLFFAITVLVIIMVTWVPFIVRVVRGDLSDSEVDKLKLSIDDNGNYTI